MNKKRLGFTLMEILIAVAIVAVLSVIAITSYSSINKRSRDAKRKSDLEQVRAALEMYRSDITNYPGATVAWASVSTLDPGDGSGLVPTYLPSIPYDPKSTASEPKYFYYPVGTVAPFYSYCLCAWVENDSETKNDCQALDVPTRSDCNYYVRNP